MKYSQLALFICMSTLFFSCKSDGSLTSGGTFKLTTSTGTNKNYTYSGSADAGTFSCQIDPNSNGKYEIIIETNVKPPAFSVIIEINTKTIEVGKEYIDGVYFDPWNSDDYENTKCTVKFSKYSYPGRVTGVIKCTDKTGKVLATGEFDFMTTE